MKRNITPFYIEGPVEAIDCTLEDKTISGNSSFVKVTGGNVNRLLSLPTRTVNNKPIVPGTMVYIVRTDSDSGQIQVVTQTFVDLYSTSFLTESFDSVTYMFVGPSESNKEGQWTSISSDVTAVFSGGTVANATTFSDDVQVGDTAVDELNIASIITYKRSLTPSSFCTFVENSTNGTATLNDEAHPNAGIITFSGTWVNGETATVTLPGDATYSTSNFILKNQPASVNGTLTASGNTLTFTATGTCSGVLEYLVVCMETL